jgi:hypothetical protein
MSSKPNVDLAARATLVETGLWELASTAAIQGGRATERTGVLFRSVVPKLLGSLRCGRVAQLCMLRAPIH